jgi:iron complex transport system permease protein
MNRLSFGGYLGLLLMSIGVWASVAAICLLVGSTGVGVPTSEQVGFRIGFVVVASLVGAALASSGVAYQAVLRNPLADPFLLGVASGAMLGVVLWRFPNLWASPGSGVYSLLATLGQQGSALVGALLVVSTVLFVSSRKGRLEPVTLLLVGVIVSSLCSAAVLLLVSIRPEILAAGGGGVAGVLVGALQTNLTAQQLVSGVVVIAAGFVVLMLAGPALSVATLSDAEATSMGVRVHRLRWVALVTASIVVGAGVAISGPIGFVGLICPHLGRMLVGPDPRRLLPVATALGAALLAAADGLCRLLAMQELVATLLPVGVITAMLGGPFFLLLLVRERGRAPGV